eukprot:CCRYP_013109-RA/>CCRYP_013109-RA protein AED:0.42 eAED:0.42 QI:0/-1/0/1/-1/1/1/0/80
MSAEKMAPIGLKNQEERKGESPIRYVPDRDPVQEALDLKPETLKCTRMGQKPESRFGPTRYQRAVCTAREQGIVPPRKWG